MTMRLNDFFSMSQYETINENARGEEGPYFQEKLKEFSARIDSMPKTYDQDGLEDKSIAHLHYFMGGSDWYITEKDVDGGINQAFGLTYTNGDRQISEYGYISIANIVAAGAEMELSFVPCSIADIKETRLQQSKIKSPRMQY